MTFDIAEDVFNFYEFVVLQAVIKFITKYFVEINTDNRIIGVNKSTFISSTTAADNSIDPG